MGGNLARGIIFATVVAICSLFAVQQWGSEPEINVQTVTSAQLESPVEHTKPLQKDVQAAQSVPETKSHIQKAGLPEPPVYQEGMTSDEFQTALREWKMQKAASEGELDRFYDSEEKRRQRTEQHELRRQERMEARAQWLASMKDWNDQKKEARRLGLPVPPRPSMADISQTADTQ